MDIVIDKSYLQGARKPQVEFLCRNHRVLMIETLFYELVTTTDESRMRCFSKIPDIENPLVIIPSIGNLLMYENENKQSCLPLRRRNTITDYRFNAQLATGEFQFTDEQKSVRDNQIKSIEIEAHAFIERAWTLNRMFTELRDCDANDINRVATVLKHEVASNHKLVKEVYEGTLGNANYPININPNMVGKNWAVYRWVQLQLIYSLDMYIRYQGNMPDGVGDNFWTRAEHDMLDSHYIVAGLLSGGLASKDQNMIDVFNLLSKNELLFT